MRTRSKLLLPPASPERIGLKPSTGSELVAAIRKSGLVGMWADRDDIRGSREFARKLRKQASNREVSDRASARH
jgi:hypothetical protein